MKTAVLTTGLSADEMEKCRLLLLKAMDDTLPKTTQVEPLMDYLERRMAHRQQFDEISQAAGWGPLIKGAVKPSAEQA